jgi:hypothetical protein
MYVSTLKGRKVLGSITRCGKHIRADRLYTKPMHSGRPLQMVSHPCAVIAGTELGVESAVGVGVVELETTSDELELDADKSM